MAEVLLVMFLLSFTCSEEQKTFLKHMDLFCRPIHIRKHFHGVRSWHLIFLLHPAALHENVTLQLHSFSLEDDIITTLSCHELPANVLILT